MRKSSEVYQQAELVHWYATAYETHKVFISYGFSQIGGLFLSGCRDTFSMDPRTCFWLDMQIVKVTL